MHNIDCFLPVPSVRNGEFATWFNYLTPDEFAKIWANPQARKIIEARLRSPGGMHEWLPVSRANVFKQWGVSAEQIAQMRGSIPNVLFDNPAGLHGGLGSGAAHSEIISIVDSSTSFTDYVRKLQNWADYRLVGGSSALPPGLRP